MSHAFAAAWDADPVARGSYAVTTRQRSSIARRPAADWCIIACLNIDLRAMHYAWRCSIRLFLKA
jgi:hypothetical protein